jgi:3-phosphoshikimate 1-carboxyvinyltransferase
VPGVSQNPTRNGLYLTLVEMGADMTFENPREEAASRWPTCACASRRRMKGIEVPPERAPSMIDEYPDPVGRGRLSPRAGR